MHIFNLKDTGNSLAKSTQVWERVRDTSGPVAPPPQRVLTGEEGEINQLQVYYLTFFVYRTCFCVYTCI